MIAMVGASGSLNIVPGSASIANQVYAKFLSRLPRTRTDLVHSEVLIENRMKAALEKLSEITGDPKVATRDPMSSLSFSCLHPEIVKSQTESLKFYRKGQEKAFSPLGPDGRPIRKYVDTLYFVTSFSPRS